MVSPWVVYKHPKYLGHELLHACQTFCYAKTQALLNTGLIPYGTCLLVYILAMLTFQQVQTARSYTYTI